MEKGADLEGLCDVANVADRAPLDCQSRQPERAPRHDHHLRDRIGVSICGLACTRISQPSVISWDDILLHSSIHQQVVGQAIIATLNVFGHCIIGTGGRCGAPSFPMATTTEEKSTKCSMVVRPCVAASKLRAPCAFGFTVSFQLGPSCAAIP